MAKDYKKIGKEILVNVGGRDNVANLVHCATRLRFNLRDETLAKTEDIQKSPDVVGVMSTGGQYQVIIGTDVKFVFEEIKKMLRGETDVKGSELPQANTTQRSTVTKVLDTIAGIFVPIIPALAGGGMLRAVLSILVLVGWISQKGSTYQILNFMSDAPFYFLPILIANSAAKKFKVNSYIAMAIGAGMIHPTFIKMVLTAKTAGAGISLFGAPVALATYSSSVIPIILVVWIMSYIEPKIEKYTPNVIRIFGVPLAMFLIMTPLAFIVVAPIGNYMGMGLGYVIEILNNYASWLVPMLVGTFTPLLVMTGMHYGLIPIGINMLTTKGLDTVAGPGMMVSNIAQGGAAFGVAFRIKDKALKGLSVSSGFSAVLGITEPVLYGINLKFRRPLYAAMIGGGIAGFYIGIMGVARFAQVGPGLLALPAFVGDGLHNITHAVIGCIIAVVVSFIIAFILGTGEEKVEQGEE